MTSLADELPRQIARVTAKKERWMGYQLQGMAVLGLSIALMKVEIENAVAALASGDVIAMLRSYEALKGYSEDD